MATLPILTIPDPILRRRAHSVERVDDAMRKLLDDMLETMYRAPGIGLAAPQIGVERRALVMDINSKEDAPKAPICMINPEILALGDQPRSHEEGCLSIPQIYAEIERPGSCHVRYLDRDGNVTEMECEGLLATVVQHEIDHLNGVLFVDHLSRLRRDKLIKRFFKAQRDSAAL